METRFDEADFTPKLGEVRPIDIFSLERRKVDEKTVTDLVKALARDGRFLQQIAVRDEGANGYRLIFGANRLEAWKRHFGEQTPIPADIYPADTPDALITAHEFEENDLRKELTKAERKAGLLRYAAARKELEGEKPVTQVSGSGQGAKSGTMSPSLPPARGGRGNKGMAQKIAEKLGISKRSVNRDVEAASFAIGEKIDLDCDTPEELERKAAELERMADKRQHAEPKGQQTARRGLIKIPRRPAKPHAGKTGGNIEVARKAFDALDDAGKRQLAYYACLEIGVVMAPAVFGLADDEPELAVDARTELPPATHDAADDSLSTNDGAVDSKAEPQDDAADLGAEDLQDAGEGIAEAADQEPGGATVDQDAEQQDGAAEPDAEDLQDSGDAASCAYCNMPLWREVPCEVFNDRIYHAFCVEDGKRLAKAKQGKQIAIAA